MGEATFWAIFSQAHLVTLPTKLYLGQTQVDQNGSFGALCSVST
jgi:hypothetical protein